MKNKTNFAARISVLLLTLFFSSCAMNYKGENVFKINLPDNISSNISNCYPEGVPSEKPKCLVRLSGFENRRIEQEYNTIFDLNSAQIIITDLVYSKVYNVELSIYVGRTCLYRGMCKNVVAEGQSSSIELMLNKETVYEILLMYYSEDTSFDFENTLSYPITVKNGNNEDVTIDLGAMGLISTNFTPAELYNPESYLCKVPVYYNGVSSIVNGYDISDEIQKINKTSVSVIIAPLGDADFNAEIDQQDSVVLLKERLYRDAGSSYLPEYIAAYGKGSLIDVEITQDFLDAYVMKYFDIGQDGILDAVDCSILLKFIIERNARIENGDPSITFEQYMKERADVYYTVDEFIAALGNSVTTITANSGEKGITLSEDGKTANVYMTSITGEFSSTKRLPSTLQNIDFTEVDTSLVTSMEYMFSISNLQTLNISKLDTTNVTNMNNMFYGDSNLEVIDVSSFNTSKVTDMSNMFYGCQNLNTIYVSNKFDTTKAQDSTDLFTGCTNLKNGEITYDSSKTGPDMANYTTGYFTLKE